MSALVPDQISLVSLVRAFYARVLRVCRRALASRRFWIPLWVLPLALFGSFFASQNYPHLVRPDHYWPIYDIKLREPLANMVDHFPAESNGAKQTFRMTPYIIGHFLGLGKVGMLMMLNLFGLAMLAGILALVQQTTGDRVTALFAGAFAVSTSPGMMCFSPFDPQFDGICYALIILAMLARNPVLVGLLAFLACWCDERGVIACALVLIFQALRHHFSQARPQGSVSFWQRQFSQSRAFFAPAALAVISAWVAYFALRFYLATRLGLETAGVSIGLDILKSAKQTFHLGLWVGLEGGWIMVAGALALMLCHRRLVFAAALAVALAALALVAFSVGDVSKSIGYIFPAFFPALLYVRQFELTRNLRRLVLAIFIISFLAMNYHIWAGSATKNFYWVYPLPLQD